MFGEKKKITNYLISLLFVLAGVVFIVYPDIEMAFICRFFAAVFALAGIALVISYFLMDESVAYGRPHLALGIMSAFAALLFLVRQEAVREYFPVIAGTILLANGVVKLQHSVDMKRIDRKLKKVMEMWLVIMIFAILCIAAGAVTIFLTPDKERTLFVFVGISLVVAGITDIITNVVFDRKVKEYKEQSNTETVKETAGEEIQNEPEVDLQPQVSLQQEEPVITEETVTLEDELLTEDAENATDTET